MSQRDKITEMWSTWRSTFDEGDGTIKDNLQKMRDAMGNGEITFEQVVKQLFGVCTSGDAENLLRTSKSYCEWGEKDVIPQKEKGDNFYSQFMATERSKVEQAVHAIQRKNTTPVPRSRSGSPAIRSPEKPTISRPFPVSSPQRQQIPRPPPRTGPSVHPIASKGTILAHTSFDDEISAISAYTLDEMVRQEELKKHRALGPVRSDLTSEFGTALDHNASMESSLFPTTPRAMSSPVSLSRNKSNNSKRSFGTKSTQSTRSSGGFESVWRKEEQKYWENVVEEEQQQTTKPSKGSLRTSTVSWNTHYSLFKLYQ